MKCIAVIVALGMAAIAAMAQTPAQKFAFEVVSVKPNKSGSFEGTTVGQRGSTFSAKNATLKMLIQAAYVSGDGGLLPDERIIGGPGWMDSDHFDVLAKPSGDVRSLPRGQIASMARELPIYNLAVGRALKMKLSPDQTPPTGPTATHYDSSDAPLSRGFMRVSTSPSLVVLQGNAVPLSRLIPMLERGVGRKIIDKTELKDLYDFNVRFSATDTAVTDPSTASIFTAIQELGLKLESAKAPLDVLVIDSISAPTEN